jgi:hypothetical protein
LGQPFFYIGEVLPKSEKKNLKKICKNELILEVYSIARSEKKRNKQSPNFYIWFQLCSHKYKRIISDIWFIATFG